MTRARFNWGVLLVALGASALGLYVVAGPESIRPHSERYGMFLVTPTVLGVACLIRSLMPESPQPWWSLAPSRRGVLGVTAVGWLLLVSAWTRSKPFLWALLVPLFAGVLVSWFDVMEMFGSIFRSAIRRRM